MGIDFIPTAALYAIGTKRTAVYATNVSVAAYRSPLTRRAARKTDAPDTIASSQ
jgi:hypothetical protein